jgi:hypothetical protein
MTGRFSSSGLAGARVDLLRADGIDARVAFRPRHARDGTPFCIEIGPSGAPVGRRPDAGRARLPIGNRQTWRE